MMEKKHVKRGLILLLFVVMLVASFAFAACKSGAKYEIKLDKSTVTLEKGESIELPYTVTKNGEPDTEAPVTVEITSGDAVTYDETANKITAVKAGQSTLTVSLKKDAKISAKLTVKVPLYEISIAGGDSVEVDLGSEENITYTVKKDDVKVTDKPVKITAEGDALEYTAVGDRLKFVKEGTGKIRVALKDDPTVYAEKTYTVVKSFWSSEKQVNKDLMQIDENSVVMPGGGNQYFLGVIDGGTKYVFKATLKIPAASVMAGGQSIGLGHTLDKNDSSLWFGLRTAENGANYRMYIKNFYKGWSNGQDFYVNSYSDIEFDSDEIECITVRDGNKYWYSIGGLVGTWTDDKIDAETPTWVGIYSQEHKLTATQFSYSVEESDIAAAKAICESPVAKFEITNASVNTIVKGDTFTYRATAFGPDPSKVPEITWEIDKTEMTAGAEGTTISADGALHVAQDAAGSVTVIAKCGTLERRVVVTISQQSLAAENDTLRVDGGVVLNADGSVTFTEERNANNDSLDAGKYVEVFYSAKLKQSVTGDFSFAFTLKNLKSSSAAKFMVSFGEKGGNFIFSSNGVSLRSQYVNAAKELTEGDLSASFVAADELAVVIEVVGGHYKVTVNGTELDFGFAAIRRIEDYTSARPVLFTTGAGTSCTVDGITLTDKQDVDFIILNDNTQSTADGFVADVVTLGNGWDAKDKSVNRIYYTGTLPAGDYTISMNVTFNAALADGKLSVNIGGTDFYINNKLEGGSVMGEWGNFSGGTSTSVTQPGTFKVELKKIGNSVYFYIGGTRIADKYDATNVSGTLSFWAANFAGSSDGVTAEVADFTVTAGATIVSINGTDTIQAGSSASYTATVIGGSEDDVVWTCDDGGLTAGSATFNAETKTLTFSNDAVGTAVVKATVNGVETTLTVTASSQPADQNTALAESKGGVKQEVANGKIIFDDAGKNGVADETAYSENSTYYAILNTAQGTRATIQDNFVLEFTVSDYVTTAEYPKLMISLGGKYDQFYVVYKTDGSAQIQTMTAGDYNGYKGSGEVTNGGHWINSSDFAGFDTTAAHTYKIVCEDGRYRMYVDENEITGWNHNGTEIDLVRNPETMALPRNIMFSTNEKTTATVSGIKLTAIAGKEGKVTATHADWFKANPDGSVEVTMKQQANGDRWDYLNSRTLYTYGEEITDNCTITMDIKFAPGTYNDEALLIKFGSKNNDVAIGVIYHSTGNTKIEVQKAWGGTGCSTTDLENGIQLKIVMSGGVVTSVSFAKYDNGGTLSGTYESVNLGDTGNPDLKMTNDLGVMSFGTFIYGTPSNNVVTVSNIAVSNS